MGKKVGSRNPQIPYFSKFHEVRIWDLKKKKKMERGGIYFSLASGLGLIFVICNFGNFIIG